MSQKYLPKLYFRCGGFHNTAKAPNITRAKQEAFLNFFELTVLMLLKKNIQQPTHYQIIRQNEHCLLT